MKAVMIRELNQAELVTLKQGLRSSDAFTLRRCQILLASNQGHTPQQISAQMYCSDQCVREAIHAFHQEGLSCLKAKSHATHTNQSAIDAPGLEGLERLLHQSPRQFGQKTSLWTLKGLAQVSLAQGITSREVSDETIRRSVKKLGENWKRAKKWITSPDPRYEQKRGAVTD
jgi:transposase